MSPTYLLPSTRMRSILIQRTFIEEQNEASQKLGPLSHIAHRVLGRHYVSKWTSDRSGVASIDTDKALPTDSREAGDAGLAKLGIFAEPRRHTDGAR